MKTANDDPDKPRLSVHRGPDAWYLNFADVTRAERDRIFDAFGTLLVPTPFLPTMDADEVLRRVRRLNPEYEVRRGDDIGPRTVFHEEPNGDQR